MEDHDRRSCHRRPLTCRFSCVFPGPQHHAGPCEKARYRSRTEEVAWASIRAGSVPQRARAGIGGHQRPHGLKQQVTRLPAQAIGMLQAANQRAVPEVVDREVPGPLLRTIGRSEPTYFCGITLQTGPSHPRRTRQTGCISPPQPAKKAPGHPNLCGAADSSRRPPF